MRAVILLLAVLTISCAGNVDPAARAGKLAREAVVVDAHVDLPYSLEGKLEDLSVRRSRGDFDLPRAKAGGLGVAFMALYSPTSLTPDEAHAHADRLIDLVEQIAAAWPQSCALARTPEEARRAVTEGKVALPLGMENGSPLRTLADLRHFAERGVRYVTLTHADNNELGDSSFADGPRWHGLSPLGRELVAEMNRLGVMVDVSHVSDETFDAVLALSTAPLIATHSGCRALTPGFARNLDDARITALAERGGVFHVTFASDFLTAEAVARSEGDWKALDAVLKEHGLTWDKPEARELYDAFWKTHPAVVTSVKDVADHVDHAVAVAGIEHVGIGSDFDGIEHAPVGLEDVSCYPALLAELARRGYSDHDVRLLAGGNTLRVWGEVQRLAERSR